jgi:Domain of unknown function (DUF4386)
MPNNERMSSIKQTATMKGDTHMTTTEQTAGKRSTTNSHAPATAQTPKSKRTVSANQRRAEIVIATLFLLTAATSIPAGFFLDPLLNASGYLAWVFPHQGAIALDSVLWSINNIGIVFIAVFAFPVLRKLDEALAAGYLASRIIEGTIMMVGIIATLLLIPLSQEFLQAGAPQSSWFLAIGDVLKHAKFLGLSAVSLPILGLGGSLFTWMLFRFRLVPRMISMVGLIGYALVFFGSIAGWFGLVDVTPGSSGQFLALPVAVFEIILLPFWLFFKGFKTPEAHERIVAAE